MKRVKRKDMPDGERSVASMQSEVMCDLAPLVEHCAVLKYDDGESREPGWLTIKTKGQAWIVQVKDPDSSSSFEAVGETLDKALSTAALLLAGDNAPWQHDQWLASSHAKRRKK